MPSPRLSSLWSPLGSAFGPPARPCRRSSAWLSWLVLIAVLGFAAPSADAQVFRPRTGKAAAAKAAPGAATALAAKKPAASGATKPGAKATPARRTVAKKKRTRPRTDDDTVVIDDDDDEPDVKITDD